MTEEGELRGQGRDHVVGTTHRPGDAGRPEGAFDSRVQDNVLGASVRQQPMGEELEVLVEELGQPVRRLVADEIGGRTEQLDPCEQGAVLIA